MNILYYFQQKNTPMYLWQNTHFIEELQHHNIYIEVFNPLNYGSVDEANQKLILKLNEKKYALFMTCHNDKLLYIDTLKTIKQKGIPTLLICFDNLLIPFEHKKICTFFDLVWLTATETKYLFDSWRANTIFAPYAANPYTYYYQEVPDEIRKMVFNGTPYGSRANIINLITNNDISIDVYSNISNGKAVKTKHSILEYVEKAVRFASFPIGRKVLLSATKQKLNRQSLIQSNNCLSIKPGVEFDEISKLYSKYALALSSTSARDTGILKQPVKVIVLRCFEIPMSGGILFCEYNNEIAGYFEEDKEAVYYRSGDELAQKAKFYLSDKRDIQRQQIRKSARNRSINEHTWYKRFELIFSALGIDCRY